MRPSAAWKALKKYAAAKPGAWEDHPWGETVYKVAKKVFVFLANVKAIDAVKEREPIIRP